MFNVPQTAGSSVAIATKKFQSFTGLMHNFDSKCIICMSRSPNRITVGAYVKGQHWEI